MIISTLTLKNFMNITSAELHFQKGLNVLAGKNGQGKSAILEAIAFCTTGRRRGDSWKDYIRSGSTSFYIELKINHNNKDIVFKYTGEKNSMSLSRTIVSEGKTYVNSECDSFIETAYDIEMLENVLFTMQDSPSIVNMMPMERRNIFKKVFNTDFVDSIGKIKDDLDSLNFAKIQSQTEYNLIEGKQYSAVDSRIEIIDEDKIDQLKVDISSLSNRKSEYEELFKSSQLNNSLLDTSILKIDTKILDLNKKKNVSESFLADSLESKVEKDLEDLSIDIHASHLKKEALNKSRGKLEISLSDLLKKDAEGDLEKKESSLRDILSKLSLIDTQIETSLKGECISCGQKCSDNHIKSLKQKKENILPTKEKLESEISSLKIVIDSILEIKEEIKIISNKIDYLDSNISKETSKRDFLNVQLKELKLKKEKEYIYLESIKEQIRILIEEKKDAENQKRDLSQVSSLLLKTEQVISTLSQELLKLETSKSLSEEKKKTSDKVKEEKEKDRVRKEELLVLLNSKDQEEKDLSIVKQIFEIHLPNYINQKACEVLQKYMSVFLSSCKEDFLVDLKQSKKGIDFFYKAHKESDWLPAKLASGFESALLTLAFKCAVANAYGSQLLILDEPDKAATESASSTLFQTITEDLKGSFEQIFIITHRNNSLEYLQENGAKIYQVHQGVFELYD
jgi:exonuclease SbcC